VSYGLGRLSNAAGPLIIAALYNGSGYRSVFVFIAGTWLFGAIVLALFGPRTRRALGHPPAEAKITPTTA
jgi:putative MFS transporter